MRLPAERIKEAILNADRELREAAVDYFAHSFSRDPTVMPRVIQAFETYGEQAFESAPFLSDLAQSDESIAWLISQIERIDPEASEESDELLTACVAALRNADAAALRPHAAEFPRIESLDDSTKRVIAERLRVSEMAPDALWSELTRFCERLDQQDPVSDDDQEFASSLARALVAHPDHCVARVLEILDRADEIGSWLQIMAVRMAGQLQLQEAAPRLIDLLGEFDYWICEDARTALIQIGGDSLAPELVDRYAAADRDMRIAIAFLLEDIHSDASVAAGLSLLEQEQDPGIQGILIRSALMNFSTEAIEPARRHILANPKSPDVLEVRSDLLVAAKMLNVSFPERDAWTEDTKNDSQFRREWYATRFPLGPGRGMEDVDADSYGDEEEFDYDLDRDFDDDFDEDDDEVDEEPPGTIVRRERKVGRNDPCPCGSGKKFKKCCAGKQAPR